MYRKLALIICLTLLGIIGLFFYVDHKVATRLHTRKFDQIPAVYSDYLYISPRLALSPQNLAAQLVSRRYRQVNGPPQAPGEFRITESDAEIITRQFKVPGGDTKDSMQVSYNFKSGAIVNSTIPNEAAFYLEPQIVSTLGTNDIRASTYKRLDEIPVMAKKAIIAIEDERFYTHAGIDLLGMARALWADIKALSLVQGGSTINQQLAKNLLFSPQKTIGRKILEIFAALSLEQRLSKDQILELYLNEVYFGQEGSVAIHGIAEAVDTFFGKSLDQLTLSEAAFLAGLIKAPSYYSPRRHLDRATARRDIVLQKMLELGYCNDTEYTQAKKAKLSIIQSLRHPRSAPHFIASLEHEVANYFDPAAALLAGVSIYTGLNVDIQLCAEHSVTDGVAQLEKQYKSLGKTGQKVEAALVAIEPFSGKVRAWAGGRDFSENQFDHISQGKRQIGSTIKPFLYLTALDADLNSYKVATPISILSDRPMQLDLPSKAAWEPENFDRKYRGDVTLRYALENSLNLPAVSVGQKVGIPALVTTASKFRLSDNLSAVPALALGAADTTLLNLTAAYGALANGGIYVAPRLFIAAQDGAGEILATNPITEQRVAGEAPVYVLTNILQGVIERGTGHIVRALGYTGPAAGKTGTSSDARDAWFIGFTPNLVAGVWVGFDDNSKLGLTGAKAAAPIWTEFMKCVAPYREELPFIAPRGVVFVDLDSESGELATASCPSDIVVKEVFVQGTEPTSFCRLHGYNEVAPRIESPRSSEYPREKRRRRSFWERLFGG